MSEGPKLEFKHSTGELREGLQTACAFLNGDGGKVMFGVKPDGVLVGQDVSDQTLRGIAQAIDGFEPQARIETDRVRLKSGREILVFHVEGLSDTVPFTNSSRAFDLPPRRGICHDILFVSLYGRKVDKWTRLRLSTALKKGYSPF